MDFDRVLTLESLGQLDDGTTKLLIERALQEILDDCDNRPALTKARKVTIQVSVEPQPDERGAMKGILLDTQVKTSLPARQGRREYLRTTIIGNSVKAFLPDNYEQNMFTTEENN